MDLIGDAFEPTSRNQVVGLHQAAERSPEAQVAFIHGSDRVVLSLHALAVLKQRMESKSLGKIDPSQIDAPPRTVRVEDGRQHTTQPRGAMVELDAPLMAEAVVTDCPFIFLIAAELRNTEMSHLPPYRELRRSHPDWLVRHPSYQPCAACSM